MIYCHVADMEGRLAPSARAESDIPNTDFVADFVELPIYDLSIDFPVRFAEDSAGPYTIPLLKALRSLSWVQTIWAALSLCANLPILRLSYERH